MVSEIWFKLSKLFEAVKRRADSTKSGSMDILNEFRAKLNYLVDDLSDEIVEKGYLEGLKEKLITDELKAHLSVSKDPYDPEFRIRLFEILVQSMEASLVKELDVSNIGVVERMLPGLRRRAFRTTMELTVWDFSYRDQANTLLGHLEREFLSEDKRQDSKFFKKVLEESFAQDTEREIRANLKRPRAVPLRRGEYHNSYRSGAVVVDTKPMDPEYLSRREPPRPAK